MARIRVLADELVNRIAAGEVVERPASVLKELVDNSLDAGATRIEVELAQGGRSLVRVADDGCGMDPDDLLLALERHATSKIGSAADLQRIATLGFRGEALPSIAAVSRLRLASSDDPGHGGSEVVVEGGRVLAVRAIARGRGTTAEVSDLFFNLPARLKFLHAAETELRHAQDTLWGAALAKPQTGFVLRHGARTLIDVAGAADEATRLRELLRSRGAGEPQRFEAVSGGARVWGLLAEGGGSSRPMLHLMVNRRPVRDRLLAAAVLRGLRDGGGGSGLRVVVFVEVEPEMVDVNVHPAKAEVRFARAGEVFLQVERAVRSGVAASSGQVEVRRFVRVEGSSARVAAPLPDPFDAPVGGSSGLGLFSHPAYEGAVAPPTSWLPPPHSRVGSPSSRPPDTPLGRLIGQYRSSFLLLEDDLGLVIVDQHVAHERVLYERVLRRLEGERAPSQRLLEPILLEVGDALAGALPRVEGLLSRVGLEVDAFGPGTVRLAALPSELGPEPARELVEELLERATRLDPSPEGAVAALTHEIAAGLSCRAAIKINHPLTAEEQRALVRDLAATENPYRCPHGRPIVLRLSEEEMERRLGRR